jgi:hypothetical protein
LGEPSSIVVDIDDDGFIGPLHAHFSPLSTTRRERVFEQQRKDVRRHLQIGSQYRKVGGDVE